MVLTKITATKNEFALSYHKVHRLFLLTVIFVVTMVEKVERSTTTRNKYLVLLVISSAHGSSNKMIIIRIQIRSFNCTTTPLPVIGRAYSHRKNNCQNEYVYGQFQVRRNQPSKIF